MLKRSDGRWQEKIILPGMSKPKYFYGSTQKEVRKKIAEWNAAEKESGRFEKVAEAWSVWHADRVSYNASEAYRTALQRTIDHFRGRPVDTIGADEIDAYIQYLAGRGYSRRTVQQYRDLLNMIFNYAIVHRMATVNPVGAVKLPAGLPKTRREIPSDEQLQRVREGVNLEFGLFAFMLLYTGLRRGELLGLRWEDVDRAERVIHVRRAVYFAGNSPQIKEPKTEAGRRDVILLDALADVLPPAGKGYIFGGEKPLTKSSLRKRWVMWARQAGLATAHETTKKGRNGREYTSTTWEAEVTPHQLRHAFATMLFDAGIDVKDAQEILGHASIQVTRDVYTHIRQARKDETAKRINSYLEEQRCQSNVIVLRSKG